MRLEQEIGHRLIDKQCTLSVAESCTGGLITHKLTNISGISQVLTEAGVYYSNESKIKRLGIPKRLIERFGAVSAQVAGLMAQQMARRAGTHLGLSTTGIAGPTGGTKKKPVGLVYVGLYTPDGKTIVKRYRFRGTRLRIKEQAARAALTLLKTVLEK